LHKAEQMPKQQCKDEVEMFLTGKAEPSELICFKVYRSQLPVIEQAIEYAARMLGSDKSRGYCLEMVCADFLAGVSGETEDAMGPVNALSRYFRLMPHEQQLLFRGIIDDEFSKAPVRSA
jgi:hypothetical protein